jgi:DNA-directed RNA polymerase subunit RPC12/RpoP
MSRVIVKMRSEEDGVIWHLTHKDCVYKCPNCGTELRLVGRVGASCPKCNCGTKMQFRWWTDRDDIEFETIKN